METKQIKVEEIQISYVFFFFCNLPIGHIYMWQEISTSMLLEQLVRMCTWWEGHSFTHQTGPVFELFKSVTGKRALTYIAHTSALISSWSILTSEDAFSFTSNLGKTGDKICLLAFLLHYKWIEMEGYRKEATYRISPPWSYDIFFPTRSSQ